MADVQKKISEMLTANTLRNTDFFMVVSGQQNYKITVATIKELLGGGGGDGGLTPKGGELQFTSSIINLDLTPVTGEIGE